MRHIPLLGELTQDPRFADVWRSAARPVPFFSGEPLPFVVDLPADGDRYPRDADEAVAAFFALGDRDRLAASEHVYKNYWDFLQATDIEPLGVEEPHGIWPLVHPQTIVVTRRLRRMNDVFVQVLCQCDWEREHGLQLVFRGGNRLVYVSEQCGHLTYADACDVPDEEDPWLLRA
jgi:hypothetical protein